MTSCRLLVVATLCLFSCVCRAVMPSAISAFIEADDHPVVAFENGSSAAPPSKKSPGATGARRDAGASMCDTGDKVVFSCPLAAGSRIASLCAVQSKGDAAPTFYYAIGQPGAAEFRFPASGKADNAAFRRTHLGLAGNTGGYAYSFVNAGYKYIVYSMSGERAAREGGVIAQPSTNTRAATRLTCRSAAITETGDDSLIDASLRLKKDPQIQSEGLPGTRQTSFPTHSIGG